jgi:hypothetical protein
LAGVLEGRLATTDGDRGAWLATAVARAGGWAMASLATRYEEHYRELVVGGGS